MKEKKESGLFYASFIAVALYSATSFLAGKTYNDFQKRIEMCERRLTHYENLLHQSPNLEESDRFYLEERIEGLQTSIAKLEVPVKYIKSAKIYAPIIALYDLGEGRRDSYYF